MCNGRGSATRRSVVLWLGIVPAFAGPGSGRAALADDEKATPKAESVLRRMADFYKKAQTLAVEVERAEKFGPESNTTRFALAFRRPNRFAIRPEKGGLGVVVVSDGKTMFVSIPPLGKYTEAEAPATFDLSGDPIVQETLQGLLIGELCAADPYEKLMEGVKSVTHAGQDAIDGAKAHHLKFVQDQFDWEIWVAAEGDPLVRRARLDMTKMLANVQGAEKFKDQKMELIHNYKDWRIDPKLDETTFAFQPPPGAQKVASFLEGLVGGGQEAESPLLGEPAPDVDLKTLDGGQFRLKEQRDARVVMLDFWATWCGPCVRELPILAEVADAYKDKGVTFCAVNLAEGPDEVRKFLREKKLKMTVALDAEEATGTAYHAQAIPMLVLVDKKGVVQAVHVGYDPAIKATLRKELDALLAGKDLPRKAPHVEKAAKPKDEGLERAWSVEGAYASVTADAKGRAIYAIQRQGRCDVLDPDGKTTRTFHLADDQHAIARFARQAGGSGGLLAFNVWGDSVLACKDDGAKLWEESGGQGIDDVWAADLDGDGIDEAIVGYNGATGLHVFTSKGKRLWKCTNLGNVWHVAAGDLDGDGKSEVVSTSAQGKVHVFAAADGRPLRTLDAGLYANMIRTAPGRPAGSSKGDVVLVIGSGGSGEAMVSLAGDGKALWTTGLPTGSQHCDSLAVSPDGTWAAAGLRGGRVCVVDVESGRIVAQATGQGPTPMVAWAAGDDAKAPRLLVATGRAINAFRVIPVAAPSDDGHQP